MADSSTTAPAALSSIPGLGNSLSTVAPGAPAVATPSATPTNSTLPAPSPLTATQQAENARQLASGTINLGNTPPSAISGTAISSPSPTPINVTQPATATGNQSLQPLVDAAFTTVTPATTGNPTVDAEAAAVATSKQTLLQKLFGSKGQTDLTNDAYSATDSTGASVNTDQTALNDINNQLISEKAGLENTKAGILAAAGGTTGGAQDAINRASTESLQRQANLAVIQLSLQGKYDSAKTIADRQVQAGLEDQKNEIDALTMNYQDNKDQYTKDEQRQYDAMILQKQQAYDKAQVAAKNLSDAKLDALKTAATNGASADVMQSIGNATSAGAVYSALAASTASSDYVLGQNPTVDSHITNVLNGTETMAQVPAGLRNLVSKGLASQPQTSFTPTAASKYSTAANKIVSNFIALPQYTLAANALPNIQKINAAIQNPNSVSDQDLLDSITQLNTGGNGVKDAQVSIITNGQSLSDYANTLKNKLTTGGVLSDTQRQQIQQLALATFNAYKQAYQPVYDQATKQLIAAGIPKAFWSIPDLNSLSSGVTTSGTGTASINGTSYNTGDKLTNGSLTLTVQSDGTLLGSDGHTYDSTGKQIK